MVYAARCAWVAGVSVNTDTVYIHWLAFIFTKVFNLEVLSLNFFERFVKDAK